MQKTAVKVTDWPEVLQALSQLQSPPRRVLLYGPPGTGKTTWAASLSPESERVTLTQAMFPDALLGKFLLRDGSTVWTNAFASRASIAGVPLILDEIHKAGGELDSTLQAILDDEAICRLNLDNGTTIVPAAGFRVIATMNGSPDQLAEPVLDRFDVVLKCATPHTGILRRLSPDKAQFILNKMKNEPESEPWVPSVSVRRMLAVENLENQGFDRTLAYDVVFGEGQGKAIQTALIDAQRNIGANS